MKKIIILLLVPFGIKSQSVHFTVSTMPFIFKIDSAQTYSIYSPTVRINQFSGKITITGDTVIALNILAKWILFKDSVIEEKNRRISAYQYATDASKDFMNNLPDIFKDDSGNCKWSNYKKRMKNLGYAFSYNKHPKPICTK